MPIAFGRLATHVRRCFDPSLPTLLGLDADLLSRFISHLPVDCLKSGKAGL
jgi:hypothetical protein